jgi:antitoxin component YwqK of YwqJK toxin-antitoxin module/Tfp pilus assembly protein PilF
MLRMCFFGWVILCCVSTLFAQVTLVNSGEVIKKGVVLYDSGKYQQAINEFLKVHPSDTNYVYMQSELALACLGNKSYDSVVQICETATKKPSQYRAHMLKSWAIALDRAGKLEESISVFKKGIDDYPFSHSMHFNLGVTYFNAKKYDDAEKSLMRALEINPYHAGANLNLAKLSALRGRKAQAMLSLGVYLSVQEGDNSSLVYLERLSKNEIEDEGSLPDETVNPFGKLDRILKAKVALEKGFKNKVDVDAALVKQMQLLIDQLPAKDDSNFWCRFYYPFYERLKSNGLIEPFLYHILSSSSIQSVPKWKAKNKKELQAFYDAANAALSDVRSRIIAPSKFGYSGAVNAWHSDNRALEAIGEMTNDKRVGKWHFFNDVTQELTAEGEFDANGEKIGIWKYYFPNGVKKSFADHNTGLIEFFTEEGSPDSKYYLKNGKTDGEVEIFYACGTLKEKLHYKEGKREGDGATFFASGAKESTYTFKNDLMTGVYRSYYSNGQLKTLENFNEGQLDGDFTSYYADGKLERKGKYRNGKSEGEWLYYHDNGRLEKKGTFVNGTSIGEWKFYDRDGDLDEIRPLNQNGDIEGEAKIYHKSKLILTISYRNQMPVEYRFLDTTGKQISKSGDKSGTYFLKGYLHTGELAYEGQMTKGKRTGQWKTYYHSGALKYLANYKNDQLDGTWTEFFKNGHKKELYTYKDGELNGLFQEFYIHGTLKAEGYFLNGRREQLWTWYYSNGEKESEEYYLFGQLNGRDRDYKEDGKISSETNYEKDKVQRLTYFDKQGNPISSRELKNMQEPLSIRFSNKQIDWETNYTCGELSGGFKRYYPGGQMLLEFTYLNGLREGPLKSYSIAGNKESEGQYVNGTSHGVWRWYSPNGKVSSEAFYIYNKRDSLWTYYYQDGTVNTRITYKNDVRQGITQVYNPEGILLLEKLFDNGDLVSYRVQTKDGNMSEWKKFTGVEEALVAYFANGKLAYQEPYKNGLIHGQLKEYYQSGQIYSETGFENGDYHGGFEEYHSNGKLKTKGKYIRDNAEGAWLYYNENGSLLKSENYRAGTLDGQYIEYQNGKKVREFIYWCGSIENQVEK